MGGTAEKSAAIRGLLDAVAAAFGPSAFPVDDWRPGCPGAVVLTSAADRRFAASVVALAGEPPRYSVMVELYGPPDPGLVPFEIAEDREGGLPEVVELLGRYRSWVRAEPGGAPDRRPL